MIVPPDVIERVKQASDIVDVISSYVPLKRAGAYYKALSPFKKEKTPSFMVNPTRQTFVCYSSGHKGDVFQFLMLYENLDFPAALERLAARAGIELPRRVASPKDELQRNLRNKLLQLHAELVPYWSDKLAHHPAAEPARAYLRHRNIPLAWIRDYGLGYAPDTWDDLLTWAAQKNYPRDTVIAAGLAVPKDSGGAYDRFRGRLMFPIRNDRGEVVGFSGRTLNPDTKEAKYVNSPETPIFKKSHLLFGLDRAKRAILDADRAILCEGQIDVLRCHAAGILNVVAPLGTALTDDHCKLLKRHAAGILLCLDGDPAGQRAARRAADLLLEDNAQALQRALGAELGIDVVVLPPGDDPDSIILREGPEAFQNLLAHPKPFFDFLLDLLQTEHPTSSPGSIRRITEELSRFLAKVPNLVLQEQLKMRAAARLGVTTDILSSELRRTTPHTPKP
ncbi:MAG: DNA primase, partial [Verrucomicrobiia bacterium]